jgi:hypothetical protein
MFLVKKIKEKHRVEKEGGGIRPTQSQAFEQYIFLLKISQRIPRDNS